MPVLQVGAAKIDHLRYLSILLDISDRYALRTSTELPIAMVYISCPLIDPVEMVRHCCTGAIGRLCIWRWHNNVLLPHGILEFELLRTCNVYIYIGNEAAPALAIAMLASWPSPNQKRNQEPN